MNENHTVKTWSLFALGATAIVPFAVACGGGNQAGANTAGAGSVAYGQQPPPGYPGAQPGYPGAQPGSCSEVVYLRTGPGRYQPYVLLGGP